MTIPGDLQRRIDQWHELSRWDQRELGRDLRRLGLSYGEIRQMIDVKKSTLATWCRDISLTDEQVRAIIDRTGSRAGIPVDTQRKRRLQIENLKASARRRVPGLITDPLWVAGTVLYWAEGNKTGPVLGLSNSDPRAIRLFMEWSRRFHRRNAEFTLRLNLHADNDEAVARRWWAHQTELDESCFYKTFIKPDGTGHRKNHLAHGVCLVRMRRSADAFHVTTAWIDALTIRFEWGTSASTIAPGR